MMAYSEDHIALAAEYALGTLDAEERVQVEAMMSVDADFAAMVETWERRLSVLNQMVGLVEPPAHVWEKIRVAAGLSGPQAGLVLPEAPPPPAPAVPEVAPPPASEATASGASISSSADSRVMAFSGQARRWRGVAAGMTALAAALAAMIAVQAHRPELLPEGLRPKVLQQVAQAPAAPAGAPAQYVALLQTDGNSPAFILTVDAGTKNFTVRKVSATEQPGKSYELWIVSDRFEKPRSLGVIGSNDFTTRAALSAYDPDIVNQATYAVTVEPQGGSPTGSATGPIVFTGKLIETVPGAAPAH